MIRFGKNVLHDLAAATSREWLETNGIGGFACSTILGLNSRRYHALLTAALRPPTGRVVLLSKLEETLILDGQRYDLSTNQYPDAVYPRGYDYFEDFRLDPFPISTFVVDGLRLEKAVFLVHGHNTAVVQYRVEVRENRDVKLELRPLVAFRDYHALTHENGSLDGSIRFHHRCLLSVRPYRDLPDLYFAHDADDIEANGYWYRNFEYALERERGLDCVEDLFNPFTMRFDLSHRNDATVIASTEPIDVGAAQALRQCEIARRATVLSRFDGEGPLIRMLAAAGDQYIVSRKEQKTVIAGYPWFTDWGRDTMIALPGLTLTTGRPEIARSILREFAQHVDQGMLPNRFPDAGEVPEYNTIDATLWYFEAVRAFLQHTKDDAFVHCELYPVLQDIIEWHIRGTRYGIRMDEDGLITSSDPNVQLTWMDAKIGSWVVTPRNGKSVEIQALWYNALRAMEAIASAAQRTNDARKYSSLAEQERRSFNELFWNEEASCLYDVISDGVRDDTMRPNQILAVSLTHSMLDLKRSKAVVDAVERELFTPYGLRSLSPSAAHYRGRYEGSPEARDSAYHQGPIWAWLLGPFIDAYCKVHGRNKRTQQEVRQWLGVLEVHLSEAGLGHISEIFDGDVPHHPRGCFAQAWSVAEILRAVMDLHYR